MKLDIKPVPEVKTRNGDTVGTVESVFKDQDGYVREVWVQLFEPKSEPDPRIITIEEFGAIMWKAGIDKDVAMDMLYALRGAGVHPMKREV